MRKQTITVRVQEDRWKVGPDVLYSVREKIGKQKTKIVLTNHLSGFIVALSIGSDEQKRTAE